MALRSTRDVAPVKVRHARFINLAAGDRHLPLFDGSDLAPEHPSLSVIDVLQPLPYPDGSVEIAMMSHGLTNLLSHWQTVFQNVHRVLRPGGWFRIDDSPTRWFAKEEWREADCEFCKPRETLVAALFAAGFFEIHLIPSSVTVMPIDGELLAQVLANKSWHESFTIEVKK